MRKGEQDVFLAEGAVVVGDVTLGSRCSVWHNAVLRGDCASITVGAGSNVQDCAVLHGAAGFPVVVGEGVTIGHGAIVHGCTVGDNTLVGMGLQFVFYNVFGWDKYDWGVVLASLIGNIIGSVVSYFLSGFVFCTSSECESCHCHEHKCEFLHFLCFLKL